MPKISTPLTDTFIKNLKITDKAKKYYDGGGRIYIYPQRPEINSGICRIGGVISRKR